MSREYLQIIIYALIKSTTEHVAKDVWLLDSIKTNKAQERQSERM